MLLLLLWPVDKVQDLWVYAASAMAVIMYEHFYIAGILATLPCHVAFRLKWQFTILHFIYVYYFISIWTDMVLCRNSCNVVYIQGYGKTIWIWGNKSIIALAAWDTSIHLCSRMPITNDNALTCRQLGEGCQNHIKIWSIIRMMLHVYYSVLWLFFLQSSLLTDVLCGSMRVCVSCQSSYTSI